MISKFVKKLAAAVVIGHVAVVGGIKLYKKSLRSSVESASSGEDAKGYKGEEKRLMSYITDYKGVPMVKDSLKRVKQLHEIKTKSSDVLVMSYPKSGTTWISEIVYNVVHGCDFVKSKEQQIDIRVPFLEWMYPSLSEINSLPEHEVKIMKSHLPLQLLPDNLKRCKIVYIARNPRDIVVSYYHFTQMWEALDYQGQFTDFFDIFCSGGVSYGNWWSHVSDYWNLSNSSPDSVLFVTYEELSKRPVEVILDIAKFLGKSMTRDQAVLAATHCSFNQMSSESSTNYHWLGTYGLAKKTVPFYRKGKVGDWRNYLDDLMVEKLSRSQTGKIEDKELLNRIMYDIGD